MNADKLLSNKVLKHSDQDLERNKTQQGKNDLTVSSTCDRSIGRYRRRRRRRRFVSRSKVVKPVSVFAEWTRVGG